MYSDVATLPQSTVEQRYVHREPSVCINQAFPLSVLRLKSHSDSLAEAEKGILNLKIKMGS